MFNVTRTYPAPNSIKKNQYNKEDVLAALRRMFFDKCYLCERDNIHDAEVEHFIPHQSNKALKFDWDNLYYSCSRCNSIKSNTHVNLLDCANASIDVGRMINCMMPSVPDGKVIVAATIAAPCANTTNTIDLLEQCYNLKNTALRSISRDSLIEQMWDHYTELLQARKVLRKGNSGSTAKVTAEEIIEAMLVITHPFSIFWRYYYLNDAYLVKNYSKLRVGF